MTAGSNPVLTAIGCRFWKHCVMSSINPAATLGPVAEGLAPISFSPVLTTKLHIMDYQQRFIEARQRIFWYINGYGVHCISSKLFSNTSTERIVELYNVELDYFRPTHN